MKTKLHLLLVTLGLAALTATAQVPGIISHQGKVTVNGTNYTGSGQFKFALVDATGTTTYWSHDGSSSGGTEPTSAVTLATARGVFSVNLGDTNVANMTQSIPASVFTNSGVYLRTWFNDGPDGSQLLSPDRQITSVGYALVAASADSVAAANITGTIGVAQLPASVLTNGASGVNISGTFSGDGAGVTNVNLMYVNADGAIAWITNSGFTLTSTLNVGTGPYSVVAADVNGDGKLDLISANAIANTLSVLTNNGSGGFVFSATLTVGSYPFSVVAADVNGDGKLDLICANSGANKLTVLTNNGSGVFGSNATLTVGSFPVSVVAADVNGDGKPDLICANNNDGTLTVLTNNGSGGFSVNATLTVGNGPFSVVAADVNGDGKLDLICANMSDDTLTVLTNNGSGVFGSNATLTVGSFPVSVVAADVNGDGKLDLICANMSDNTLTVLTNNGSGVFASNATLTVGSHPVSVTAADVNGDGKLDLISANRGTNTLTVLTNNGSGVFGSNATLTVGSFPVSVVAADVNGDGKLDLISANSGANTLSVLLNASVAAHFTGDGSGLNNLTVNAANLTGQIGVAQLPANMLTNGSGASGTASIALGSGTTASGWNSTALGSDTTASGFFSTAMGYYTTASGFFSTAMGYYTTASGYVSTALGSGTTASGQGSTALGQSTTASGGDSTALGISTVASGEDSTALGSGTTASGWNSTALGNNAQATNDYSFVWSDGQDGFFTSTANNEFSVRAGGGVRLVTGGAGLTVDGQRVLTNGDSMTGSFTGNGAGLTNIPAAAVVTPPPGMALIPAGTFTMGDSLDSESDAIPTNVTVSAFYMDVNLVSYSQWKSVYYWATNHGYSFTNAGAGKAANHPVQTVDWYDCVKWSNARSQQAGKTPVYYTDAGCTQIYKNGELAPYMNMSANGYRLPTEAEWEKAARGGLSGQRFPWGNNIDENLANYYSMTASYTYDLGPNGYNTAFTNRVTPYTSPVGSFAPNGYGLNDMAGNVFEWCGDWYGTPYGQPSNTNPTGPTTGSATTGSVRVLRGGDWDDSADNARCAYRYSYGGPSFAVSYLGFRCVRGL